MITVSTEGVCGSSLAEPLQKGYRVFARKYRPMTFGDLVGQEPVARTLINAFKTGRIAQGYMLTGVRGVGKTTTARIIARALNYQIPGEPDAPCAVMERLGVHCSAIMESRHVDVIEMDAASHTGIDDIREITDRVPYKPVSARYKVYIIDEIHMLSTQAFNGLLKTLEEPPEHVKFILATTEIRKVPVTILSRCQRFDLRRIKIEALCDLMRSVLLQEGLEAEDEALLLIARAGEGSARDVLSILDQAVTHSGGRVEAAHLRDMLGLVAPECVIGLFRSVVEGDVKRALIDLRAHYDRGADPVIIISDLLHFVHLVMRIKYVSSVVDDRSLPELERREASSLSSRLDVRFLSRIWQFMIKGIDEVCNSFSPLASAEMLLVRLAHLSDLPTPDELIRKLKDDLPPSVSGAGNCHGRRAEGVHDMPSSAAGSQGASLSQAVPIIPFSTNRQDASSLSVAEAGLFSFKDLIALAEENRDLRVQDFLKKDVRSVHFTYGHIELELVKGASVSFLEDLKIKLKKWTGIGWTIIRLEEGGAATIEEQEKKKRLQLWTAAESDPQVVRLLTLFPGAEIVDVCDAEVSSAHQETL